VAKVVLKKNEDRRIRKGHFWIFSNEIGKVEGDAPGGSLVEVFDSRGGFLASGFYNPGSLISVRVISVAADVDLRKIFSDRLHSAFELRKRIYPDRKSFRMVFSESDFMPGLIIDKYNDTYVLQIYSAGIEKNISLIAEILKEDFGARNIFTKNEEYFRVLEGLPVEDTIYLGDMSDERISDGKLEFRINFRTGHKTGFYFDQCDNREFFERFCKDKSVLDCFSNSGGFGLHALSAGASQVIFVESSAGEIKNARGNYELNNFTIPAEFIQEDVFDFLERQGEKRYDLINVDPPAFAKNRKSLPKAVKGYERLNRLAMNLLRDGGLLSTSSCSFHLTEEIFFEMLNNAALKAGKRIQLIHFNNASLDHPSLPAMPETNYLKFAVLKVSQQ
jgi:23S rRNA (cytosine1962-C5)-methyltransferase